MCGLAITFAGQLHLLIARQQYGGIIGCMPTVAIRRNCDKLCRRLSLSILPTPSKMLATFLDLFATLVRRRVSLSLRRFCWSTAVLWVYNRSI